MSNTGVVMNNLELLRQVEQLLQKVPQGIDLPFLDLACTRDSPCTDAGFDYLLAICPDIPPDGEWRRIAPDARLRRMIVERSAEGPGLDSLCLEMGRLSVTARRVLQEVN